MSFDKIDKSKTEKVTYFIKVRMSFDKIDTSSFMASKTKKVIENLDYETLKKLIIAREALPEVVQKMNDFLDQRFELEKKEITALIEDDGNQQQDYKPLADIDQGRNTNYLAEYQIIYQECITAITELQQNVFQLKNQIENLNQQSESYQSDLLHLNEQITKRDQQRSRVTEISESYEKLISPEHQSKSNTTDENKQNLNNQPDAFNITRFNYLMNDELRYLRGLLDFYKVRTQKESYVTFLRVLEKELEDEKNSNLNKSQVDELKRLISLNFELTQKYKSLEQKTLESSSADCKVLEDNSIRKIKKLKTVNSIQESIWRAEIRTNYAAFAAVISGLGAFSSFFLIAVFATNPMLLIIPGIFMVGVVASMIAAVGLQIAKHLHIKEQTKVENQVIDVPEGLKNKQNGIKNEITEIESNIKQLKSEIEKIQSHTSREAPELNTDSDNPYGFFNEQTAQKQTDKGVKPENETKPGDSADLEKSEDVTTTVSNHNRG